MNPWIKYTEGFVAFLIDALNETRQSVLTHSVPGVKKLSKFVENYNRRFSLHTDYESRFLEIFI